MMWHSVGTAMCWWTWTRSGCDVSCSTMCCSWQENFFYFKIKRCSWGFRFPQRCCWRFMFSGTRRHLAWLTVDDVSNDCIFLIHRIEKSKIQLGYFFDCWALNVKVLPCFERSGAASATTLRNISKNLNAQKQRCRAWKLSFQKSVRNIYHQLGRLGSSSSHFLVSCRKYIPFTLTTIWPILVTEITSVMKKSQRTSKLHIIFRVKAVCFLCEICWLFVGSSSETRSRDFYHSVPKFRPVIINHLYLLQWQYVGYMHIATWCT
jgi:hypothetical protein